MPPFWVRSNILGDLSPNAATFCAPIAARCNVDDAQSSRSASPGVKNENPGTLFTYQIHHVQATVS